MCKGNVKIKDFMKKDWSGTEKVLVLSTLISTGFVLGFLLSPIKKGMSFKWVICSHNGNHNGNDNNATSEGKCGLRKKNDRKEKGNKKK